MTAKRLLKVFLCHASQDKLVVRKLYSALKAEGWIDPWIDKANILPGQDWQDVIKDAVEDADIVIVCLSSQSVSKEGFVQKEMRYAFNIALEKPESAIFLIPLRLNDCGVPRELRHLQYVDYFDSQKRDAYRGLLQGLQLRYKQVSNSEEQSEPDRNSIWKFLSNISIRKKTLLLYILTISSILFVLFVVLRILPAINEPKLNNPFSSPAEALTSVTASQGSTETFAPILGNPISTGGSFIIGQDGVISIYVLQGSFLMGSTDEDSLAEEDEKPQSPVDLNAFWIDKTEVTNRLFSSFVGATGYKTDAEIDGWAYVLVESDGWMQMAGANWRHPSGPDSDIQEKEYHPVLQISWNDAVAYCKWSGKRLPTEAEWEKAARGTEGRIYPWGDNAPNDDLLNYNFAVGKTLPIGFYPNGASFYGVLDMAGNVWEWVSSAYKPYPYDALDGREDLTIKVDRVVRGGSMYDKDGGVRSADRYWFDPDVSYNHIGFRCGSDISQ